MSDKVESTEGYPRVLKGTQGYSARSEGTQGNSKGTHRVLTGYSEDSNNYPTVDEPPLNKLYNLRAEIAEFAANSPGAFSVADIDRELGIGKDQARNRRKILSALHKEKKIIRIKTGVYERSNVVLEKITRRNVNINPFDIELPLGLSDLVRVPKKSIMVIAGTSNAGKTQFALELMKLNLRKEYNLAYFMSEMGSGEYVNRVTKVCKHEDEDIDLFFDRVYGTELSSGFAPAIATYCPDGLGVIDYLEATDGEYYRLTNDIKMIYDRLEDGVALICMQKASNVEHARGGEGTKEKARLYMNLDTMFEGDYSTLVALRIMKAKEPKGKNVTGMEIHLEVSGSSGIVPISGWMRIKGSKVSEQRKEMFERYQSESDGDRRIRLLQAVPYQDLSAVPSSVEEDDQQEQVLF